MTVLEDLWYGNIRPVENYIDGNMEYKNSLRLVSKNREVLENELSPKQLDLFDKYNDSVNELNSKSETTAFQYGFSFGVRLMMESFSLQLTTED